MTPTRGPEHLDNIFWHAMAGAQAAFADGAANARRYARGGSPILAFADPQRPDFAAIGPFCAARERFHCDGWTGPVPDGWRLLVDATMRKMVYTGTPDADDVPGARALGAGDAPAAIALARLTNPGPFGARTLGLGDWLGVFDDRRGLVAMAGERAYDAGWRELSGVCTHPGHQGRGLARRLMEMLVRRQYSRGERTFLHVATANTVARALYARMGFVDHAQSAVRVIERA